MRHSPASTWLTTLLAMLFAVSLAYRRNSLYARRSGQFPRTIHSKSGHSMHLQTTNIRSLHTMLSSSNNVDEGDEAGESATKKSTKFDRMVDDFIGKKFGAGEAFYGKRLSDLSEEEFADRQQQQKRTESIAEYESKPMKGNAVLVVGDISSDVFMWVALDLLEKGFTVRVACSSRKKFVQQFGQPGYNADLIELSTAAADDYDPKRYARAVQDCQAVIFCNNFNPVPSLLMNNALSELTMAARLLDMIVKARNAKVGTVCKIVNLSRAVPGADNNAAAVGGVAAALGSLNSIVNNRVFLLEGADDVEGPAFAAFRKSHVEFEQLVRDCGVEYVNVRAPPVVQAARPGAVDDMAVLSADDFTALNARVKATTGSSERSKDSSDASAAGCLTIGALDIAEAAVQALLLENIEGRSFTVCARSSRQRAPISAAEMQWSEEQAVKRQLNAGERPARESYYSILSLDDYTDPVADPADAPVNINAAAGAEEQQQQDKLSLEQRVEEANQANYAKMRSSYMIRSVDSVRKQLMEDIEVEQYWLDLMQRIPRD